jgi:hypothetical protein
MKQRSGKMEKAFRQNENSVQAKWKKRSGKMKTAFRQNVY